MTNSILNSDTGKTATSSSPILTNEESQLQQLLANGAYHHPRNKHWWQDFAWYTRNNHALFSVCCQSPLHPISKGMRVVGLLGSIMIGLVLTNIIYLWQLQQQEQDEEAVVVELSAGGFALWDGTSVTYIDDEHIASQFVPSFEFSSTAMIILWTVGSAAHSLFDTFLWYASSCQGCDRGSDDDHNSNSKTRKYCNILIVILVILVTMAATLAVLIRAMIDYQDGEADLEAMLSESNNDSSSSSAELQQLLSSNPDTTALKDGQSYFFLQAYAIELALAWFFWYFVVEGLMFSGILSCGGRFLPSLLGGRPFEVEQQRQQQKEMAKKQRSSNRTSSSKSPNNSKKIKNTSSSKNPNIKQQRNSKAVSSTTAAATRTKAKK